MQVFVSLSQLLSAEFGTAVLDRCRATTEFEQSCTNRLFSTRDLGNTWTDITPHGMPLGTIVHDAFFLDPLHGWVTTGDCAAATAALYRTTTGGRTWRSSPGVSTTCNAGATVIPDFVDPAHGWLLHLEPTAPGATLQRTSDGGITWSKPQRLPSLGGIEFHDSDDGWLGGGGFARNEVFGLGKLFRTEDGGRTWQEIKPPVTPGVRRSSTSCGLPSFFHTPQGVLACTVVRNGAEIVVFDVTSDGGETWRVAGSLALGKAPPPSGSPFPLTASTSVASPTIWWVVRGTPPVVYVTTDAGQTWDASKSTPARPEAITAIDARVAWLETLGRGGRSRYVTTNGGSSWVRLTPSS